MGLYQESLNSGGVDGADEGDVHSDVEDRKRENTTRKKRNNESWTGHKSDDSDISSEHVNATADGKTSPTSNTKWVVETPDGNSKTSTPSVSTDPSLKENVKQPKRKLCKRGPLEDLDWTPSGSEATSRCDSPAWSDITSSDN